MIPGIDKLTPEDPVLVIAGPTAVGKTALSIALAHQFKGEIISADSRQIYKELTIGTAKPDLSEQDGVPHHFIDEIDLNTHFSAGIFAREAYQRIQEIHSRGHIPIVVGGSTLYLYALQFGLSDIPPTDSSVRKYYNGLLEEKGRDYLYQELLLVDPVSAATMDATKTQRLVRALEVFHGTGKPLSYYHQNKAPIPYAFRTLVLDRDRKQLYDRINRRVDEMMAAGLLKEVQEILDEGVDPNLSPLRTIGYAEAIEYLSSKISSDEMIRLIKRNTRRYAKRQLTWFKRFFIV